MQKKIIIACSKKWFLESEILKKFLKNKNYIVLKNKNRITLKYLNKINVRLNEEIDDSVSSYWQITAFFNSKLIRNKVRNLLEKNNIETRTTFPPVHTMPMYYNKSNRKKLIQVFLDNLMKKDNKKIITHKEQIDLMSVCFSAEKSIRLSKKIKIKYL